MQLEQRGCIYHEPRDWRSLDGMHVISFCNGEYLKSLPTSFASFAINLDRTNNSIGVWDASHLELCIETQKFQCTKGYYWQGHRFNPYIAHFGGGKPSQRYRDCVAYLTAGTDPVMLPLFAPNHTNKSSEDSGIAQCVAFDSYSANPSDCNGGSKQVGTTPRRSYDFSHWDSLPKVSCQCITYGRPELLCEAVQSFLVQDYPGPTELVILNDCSDVLIELQGYSNIHVENVKRRFRSIGEKRNACCALCTGDVILPWDDDDISLPWRISVSIEMMKNCQYAKPNRLWYWGEQGLSVRKSVGHAMGAWSRELFDKVQGYPHIQSGQDQAFEDLFAQSGLRQITPVPDADLFYIYRFPGTGSYHLSAHGFGKGFDDAASFVANQVAKGTHTIRPHWKRNYVELLDDAIGKSNP